MTATGGLNQRKSVRAISGAASGMSHVGWVKPKSGKSRAYRTLASGKHRASANPPGIRNTRNIQSAHPARRNRAGAVGMSLKQNNAAAFQEFRNQQMIVQQSV